MYTCDKHFKQGIYVGRGISINKWISPNMATRVALCDVTGQLTRRSQSASALVPYAELIAELLRRLVIAALVLYAILGFLKRFLCRKRANVFVLLKIK